MSVHILYIVRCSIYRPPCATMSVNQEYLFLMCLVRLYLENLPIFSKIMTLLLSCINLLCVILYPCAYMKYLDHSIFIMTLSTPSRSSSAELFLFIFFVVENLDTAHSPRDIMPPVCPHQYPFTAYEASTHDFTTDMSSTLKVSLSFLVSLRYFNIIFSFPHFSLSGSFTHVVSNATDTYMSRSALVHINISFATAW